MHAVVTGMIATYPVGGVAWDYGQYALGLERLGFDVFYLEDSGGPTYDPEQKQYGEDCSFGVRFLQDALAELSPRLGQRWHFRAMDGRTFGIDQASMADIIADAAILLNVSGSVLLRDDYMRCTRKVLIDTDPGWNHFVNYPRWDASPGWQGTHGYRAHDFFFTYAERIGRPDCVLPSLGIDWRPTRPPVVMDCWRQEPPGTTWSTVMTWDNFRQPIVHEGVSYGTKEREFLTVEALPAHVDAHLEVAVGGAEPPVDRWRQLGWSVLDSHSVSRTPDEYRRYIQQSRGEFSVAKNIYVATRSGWFSCRSVCYLAAGRPVVVQDTGFADFIHCSGGLQAFSTLEEAAMAIAAVETDYTAHQQKAQEAARKYFDSAVVLGKLLNEAGIS